MTKAALVHAALKLFGRQGYDGTSTREIAAAAKANIGSIAYHFRGKEGLRTAVADHIVETIQSIADQAVGGVAGPDPATLTPETAREQLKATLQGMVAFIVAKPEAGEIVQFMLRELADPTPTLDRIYTGLFEPTHKRLCFIWERATGEPAESEGTRLAIFSLIGQAVYFRIGREPVLRRMGWTRIGEDEAGKILATLHNNLDAMLSVRQKQT
nr:CerR family C-terminal domain-containing protein [Mesorhizobium loti]